MEKTLDSIYYYIAQEKPSHCRIRVYENTCQDERLWAGTTWAIIIATQLWDHPERGASVSNVEPQLLNEIFALQQARHRFSPRRVKLEGAHVDFVVHFPYHRGERSSSCENFFWTRFVVKEGRLVQTGEHRINREHIEEWIEQSLDN